MMSIMDLVTASDRNLNHNLQQQLGSKDEGDLPTVPIRPVAQRHANEMRFLGLIGDLGTFKIKKKESAFLLNPYFMIKLNCNRNFSYETIVVGDEFETEEDAREDVFRKAVNVLLRRYKGEIVQIQKFNRKKTRMAESTNEVEGE